MHCLILIATLLVSSATSQSANSTDTESPDTTVPASVSDIGTESNLNISSKPTISQPGPELNADTGNKSRPQEVENCIHICLNVMNVVIFGVIISLVFCICAVICQQQPREVFYLVDRVPESNAAIRPTTLSIDPKIRTGKSQQSSPSSKEPVATSEPLITPKHSRTAVTAAAAGAATDSYGSTTKKSVKVEISPHENVTMAHSPFYTTQGSIEDDPVPIISLQDSEQIPSARIAVPVSEKIPIVISESADRVSEPSSPVMLV